MSFKTKWIASLGALYAVVVPGFLQACPVCMASTPYRYGLLTATAFLLVFPFLIGGGLFWWIRRHSGPSEEKTL